MWAEERLPGEVGTRGLASASERRDVDGHSDVRDALTVTG